MSVPLTKVDSAIAGLSIQDEKPSATTETTETEVKKKDKKERRPSGQADNVWNIKDLGEYIPEHQPPISETK